MIKIVKGVYGYMGKDGFVRPKTPADGPFSLSEDQEARLVGLGVAEYVGGSEPATEAVETVPAEDAADEFVEKPLEELTAKELRELAKDYGLAFKVGMSKAAMIEAIRAEMPVEAEDDGEELPDFDAAEAVE